MAKGLATLRRAIVVHTKLVAHNARVEGARERRRWMRRQGMFDPAQLVFIDESWTNTSMVRLRGRCPRGERLIGYAPLGHWKTITFVAGLRIRAMVAPFVVEGRNLVFEPKVPGAAVF
jgi:putative transposase